jgi:hypothetical protein
LTLDSISPFSQAPLVYEPRKNSSAISRSSTPSQYGKLALRCSVSTAGT